MKDYRKILTTKDYSIFNYINGNREINNANVKRLVISMKENYEFTLIIVNEHMEIIDGQHRIEACKELGLEVSYVIINGLNLKGVQRYNSNQKTWGKMDYAISYANAGIKSYNILLEFINRYPEFNVGSAENMLTNTFDGANEIAKRLGVGSSRTKAFQNGDLEISMEDMKRGYKIVIEISKFRPFFNKYNSGVFVKTIISLLRDENYDNNRMINQLKKYPTLLVQCPNVRSYKLLLHNIYNRNKTHKNRVSLYI